MTSASELFSTRRSRPGRSDPDLESDTSSYRYHSHNHHRHLGTHHHNQHHDSDGCDLLRRPTPRLRRFCHHTVKFPSKPICDVQGTAQYLNPDSSTNTETQSGSFVNLSGSERLPGAVLLARARLFERLRGVSLSGNSRSNRVSLGAEQRESSFHSTDVDPIFQLEGLQVTNECNKKPQGLTQDAINCLHQQTFSSAEVKTEMRRDYSICLESFTKDDTFISTLLA
ncbi:PREDICTED: probable E3 ubiquitin-protein ligase RHY1A [Camelina sativa]|uniref:Probable E3 ubiquitin-protein ligase RHY1A n=1 Tax=Camelina sativa TaxID=90675 RepID=A0ABM1QX24_CAMSA|nr:PREDICTED: probable E3 ubiquitin-protein ligase RHY1A [Camelina sativa]